MCPPKLKHIYYYVLRLLYLPVLQLMEAQVWNLLMGMAFAHLVLTEPAT